MTARSPRQAFADTVIEATYRRSRRHLIGGAIALGGVVVTGILWYKLIEGWTWLDAVYMSVITLATVGFAEVQPLGARGRIFTIVLILMGVVVIGYILNSFSEALIQGHLQAGIRLRQRRKLMDSLTDHYIICGFGRTGRQVAAEFALEQIPFVV
ncbi:MAG: potassium channel family protein, partial [Cyanobacteria bacterium P01_H01_bin.153]